MPDTARSLVEDDAPAGTADETRRDFLMLATGALAAVGAASVACVFTRSMNPSADVIAAGAPIDVDLSKVAPGQQITVLWQGHPMFIIHRTPALLKSLQDPRLRGQLRDPDSAARQQPTYAANWHRSVKPEYLILVGICTHLGCIPKFRPDVGAKDLAPGWPGGFFCPCHGSKYDMDGRVFRGVPAPYNLPVPPYRFLDEKTLRVGENPPGQDPRFDLTSIDQL
jgi:ubiquinol-cytochrome c reductase iron-sulfur subunit